jgi:hypothetical protein
MPASRAGVLTNERIAALPGRALHHAGSLLCGGSGRDYGQVGSVDPRAPMPPRRRHRPEGVAATAGQRSMPRSRSTTSRTLPGGGFLIADATHAIRMAIRPA